MMVKNQIPQRSAGPLAQLFFNQPKSLFVRKSQEILDGFNLIACHVRQGGMKSRDMENGDDNQTQGFC